MKKSDKKNLIILGIIIIGFILVAFLLNLEIPLRKLPRDTIGNTAGNLNNGGYFCEYEGKVYFANPYDHNTLYVMNSDESEVEKINNSEVRCINASNTYLVYYQYGAYKGKDLGALVDSTGIYRCEITGKNPKRLTNEPCDYLVLAGNEIYLQYYVDGRPASLHKMDLSGENITKCLDIKINPNCVANNSIYYNGTEENHYLYKLDLNTGANSTVWEGDIWNPIVIGNYVYYMDLSNRYGLSRYNLSTNEVERLTNDRVDMFNIGDNMIYYQTSGDTPALKRMRLDGSDKETVREGIHKNISITSRYVYFTDYITESTIYHTPLTGSVRVSVFQPTIEE